MISGLIGSTDLRLILTLHLALHSSVLRTAMNCSDSPSPSGLRCLHNDYRLHLTTDCSAVQSPPTVTHRRVYTYSDGGLKQELTLTVRDAMLAQYMLS